MSNLIIENCEPRFEKMVRELYIAYREGFRFSFEANFPGSSGSFKYEFNKIHPEQLYQIIIKASEAEKKDG